jgi:hypothetical protein
MSLLVDSTPVSFQMTIASTLAPVTAVNVTSAASATPFVTVFEASVCGVPIREPAATSSRLSWAAL